ncbi:hypothetical protein [Dactylosporangium sp. CA-139066]|uniref:hypothetical protein n=1 Tax=Dactylosporangium sp. CA-139066 TaxID=3239930 RepID=UPI003D89FB35
MMKLRQSSLGLDGLEWQRRDKVLDDVGNGVTGRFRQIIDLSCPENAESAV